MIRFGLKSFFSIFDTSFFYKKNCEMKFYGILCFPNPLGLWFAILITRPVSSRGHFELDKNWPDPSVSNLKFYGSGIVLDHNQDYNLILLHRSDKMTSSRILENDTIPEDTILVLDIQTGTILRSWGANKFVKPHGIEVTKTGNMFITDVRLHQVFKFEYDKSTQLWKDDPIITLGEPFTPGNDAYHFCAPAGVSVMPGNNNFFVADGYCNSRVVKFDPTGKYLLEFGAGSSHPGIAPTPFNVTHSITIAYRRPQIPKIANSKLSRDNQQQKTLVFVADRNNGRIQCFTSNGTFLYEISFEKFGPEKAMLLSLSYVDHKHSNGYNLPEDYGTLFAVNGHLAMGQPKVFEIAVSSSRASIIGSFHVTPFTDASDKIETPHDIAVNRDGNEIYIVEATGELTLRKFTSVESKSSHVIELPISVLLFMVIIVVINFCH